MSDIETKDVEGVAVPIKLVGDFHKTCQEYDWTIFHPKIKEIKIYVSVRKLGLVYTVRKKWPQVVTGAVSFIKKGHNMYHWHLGTNMYTLGTNMYL